jgi:hypothetical protein
MISSHLWKYDMADLSLTDGLHGRVKGKNHIHEMDFSSSWIQYPVCNKFLYCQGLIRASVAGSSAFIPAQYPHWRSVEKEGANSSLDNQKPFAGKGRDP